MFGIPLTRDYRIVMPHDRFVRTACEDSGCDAWRYGWDTLADETTDLGRRQAAYIRTQSGRAFREMKAPDGLTVFRFEPGQRCFADHQSRAGRLLVTHGHRLVREHSSLAGLAEDYTEHTGRLADQAQKG